ncbi:MAG: LysR family transcriptional regulator [Gammaproteobacteria bacterium]|nr:LysR family transcriptional regulator [Gammaproteobacteria bacterium]
MSKLDRIYTFVSVVEQNSFINAAKKLKTAPATITRQINALEAELGIQLIIRTTRRLKLTEIGDLYYVEAKKLLEQFDATESLIAQSQSEPSGKLTVSLHRYFARWLVEPHLAEFMQTYPKIALHLNLGEFVPDFTLESSDIIFGTLGDGPADSVRKRIMSSEFIYCASPKYLAQYGTPLKPTDLINHRIIVHTIRRPADQLTFRNHAPLHINPVLWLNDSSMMKQAAINGLGIIKILNFRVEQALKAGRLVKILPSYGEVDYPVYLYYRANRYLDPKIRAFIDFFLQKFSSQ